MNRAPLISAGALLGIGLGGFLDGIVFHQLLQSHSLFSAKIPRTTIVGLETNMFWDGIFHIMTWATTLVGLAFLWRATGRADVPHSTRSLCGAMLFGWGLFNLVEGIIDHHVLHLHHVTETANHLSYDIAFLVAGVVLIVVGGLLMRTAGPSVHAAPAMSP